MGLGAHSEISQEVAQFFVDNCSSTNNIQKVFLRPCKQILNIPIWHSKIFLTKIFHCLGTAEEIVIDIAQKMKFSIRISWVNVTKSAVSSEFGHIY